MKTNKNNFLLLSLLGLLASCTSPSSSLASNPSSNSDLTAILPSSLSIVTPSTGSNVVADTTSSSSLSVVTQDNVVEKVLGKLDGQSLAFTGKYQEFQYQGEEKYLGTTFDVETALTDSFFFYRTVADFFGLEETRVDKAPNGYATTSVLNPMTNKVETYYYGSGDSAYPFESLFINPFEKSKKSFEVVDNKITLVDANYFSMAGLINVLTAGIGFRGFTDFGSLSITYENDAPKSLEFVCYNNENLEYDSHTEMVYTGEFTTLEEVKAIETVKPRLPQPGHQKLGQMFQEIKKGNYTISVTSKTKIEDPEEWGDELPEDRVAKVYVTKDGYFQDYISGVWGADEGAYMTSDGLVEYEITEDNKLKERKLPYFCRTVDTYFGYAYNYSPVSFDINEDGSYTLASEKEFYSYVWTDLLPDYFGVSVGVMDRGSLKLVIDEDTNSLSYTYTCFEGSELYSTTITDIGTTTLPILDKEVIKYVPFTNWTEFCDSSSWNEDTGNALDLLTGGNKDILPFIDTPYNYQMGLDYDGDYNFETHSTEITWFKSMEKVFEVDTAYEQAQYVNHFFDQMFANPKYVWDKANDKFTYKDGDSIQFTVTVGTVKNYNSMDGLFKYGVVLSIVNSLQNPNAPEF